MRSDDKRRGFELLNKWATNRTSIQLMFTGIDAAISFTAVGVLTVDKLQGTLIGSGCTVEFDLTGVGFDNMVTEDWLAKTGSKKSESVEVWLRTGDKFLLATLLRVGEHPS